MLVENKGCSSVLLLLILKGKTGLIVVAKISAVYNAYSLWEVHFSDSENSAFLLVVVSIVGEQLCIQQ